MVNFRLSEEEYTDLQSVCVARGVRSISDFARLAVCHRMGGDARIADPAVESAVRELKGQVNELDHEVRRLARLLEGYQSRTG